MEAQHLKINRYYIIVTMPAGINLAETTIFVPGAVFHPVIGELKEAGLEVLPHPASAVHRNNHGETLGRMVETSSALILP
jgi:hypothetical protein